MVARLNEFPVAAASFEDDEGGSDPTLCPVRLRAPFEESKQQLVAFIAQNFGDTATVAEGWYSKQGREIPGRAVVLVHKGAPSLPGLDEQSFIAPPEPVRYARRPFRENPGWTLADLQGMSPGGTD